MSMTIEEKKAKKAAYMKTYIRAYYKTNKEKILSQAKDYYGANKQKMNASMKDYYEANKEKTLSRIKDYYEANAETKKAYAKVWRKENPGLRRAYQAKRRCSQLQRTPAWAKNDPRIKEVYRQAKLWGMEVDHVVPLQADLASGLHVWENLQLLHKSVNCSKSNHFVPE